MKALRIHVAGMVQGVGFRPFIRRIAVVSGVSGYVKNMGGGEVEIHIEGPEEAVKKFFKFLAEKKPPPARIDLIKTSEDDPRGYPEFTILKSESRKILASEIPRDLGVCEACLKEVLDPSSRWYRYPFNSCAWCGPRYSMMYKPPYDRENTAMREFPLCDKCREEYEDLWNERRYHAQGISCPRCGPRLKLLDKNLREVKVDDPLEFAAKLIDSGEIVAVKGIGGFHIACLASSDEVVLELRRRKRRPRKPFALMALNIEVAKRLVEIRDAAIEDFMKSPMKPIIILPRKEDSPVSGMIAPGLRTIGIMLPYTPLHYLLLTETRDKFLVMTSGNIYGDPMVRGEKRLKDLTRVVDYILTHNRVIVNRIDDSVIRPTYNGFAILRCGRGLAPKLLNLPFKLEKSIVAYGAELQTAGAVGFEDKIVLAPFSGDTENPLVLEDHEASIRYLMKSYGFERMRFEVAADLHPLYSSRRAAERFASTQGLKINLIQHHFAHVASSMAEWKHKPEEPAVGIAIDGVGYGLDGAIWGGEIVSWTGEEFLRLGRLEYHVMPGGDLATKYPLRMLASIMAKSLGEEETLRFFERTGFVEKLRHGRKELETCIRIVKERRGIYTSSAGRFLDSISAFLGICFERTYEGEPAIALEENSSLNSSFPDHFKDLIEIRRDEIIILTSEILKTLFNNLERVNKPELAYASQFILGKSLGEVAKIVAERFGVKQVYVSGGAAVNRIILKGIAEGSGLRLLVNRQIPANDGGLAVGQVFIAGLGA